MTAHEQTLTARRTRVVSGESYARFAREYPERPHVLRHDLKDDDRLAREALAGAAGG